MNELKPLLKDNPESTQNPELEAKKNFSQEFIQPIKSFLTDTVTEAVDAFSRLKEAVSAMSYSNDIWETYIAEAEGKPV